MIWPIPRYSSVGGGQRSYDDVRVVAAQATARYRKWATRRYGGLLGCTGPVGEFTVRRPGLTWVGEATGSASFAS